ncbi:MAG TPA: SDR family NAD(P)-dependent oxidoreductase [Acidimicrobiia bacterium]
MTEALAKTWFITGTTTGLGRAWATAALDRGDRVAATARNVDRIQDLVDAYGDAVLPLLLDVTDRAAVFDAVGRAHDHFGRLDVVVNNAGYGTYGMVEEISEQEARAQLDTNLFGALWVTQAALPFLREQGDGHILQISSVGGLMAGPSLGIYHASKWALEGLSESLAHEVRELGIKVTIVEPTGYATAAEGSARHAAPLPAYEQQRERFAAMRAAATANEGEPGATSAAILAVVDADDPPLRIVLGAGVLERVAALYESRLVAWREWEAVSVAAHGIAT